MQQYQNCRIFKSIFDSIFIKSLNDYSQECQYFVFSIFVNFSLNYFLNFFLQKFIYLEYPLYLYFLYTNLTKRIQCLTYFQRNLIYFLEKIDLKIRDLYLSNYQKVPLIRKFTNFEAFLNHLSYLIHQKKYLCSFIYFYFKFFILSLIFLFSINLYYYHLQPSRLNLFFILNYSVIIF